MRRVSPPDHGDLFGGVEHDALARRAHHDVAGERRAIPLLYVVLHLRDVNVAGVIERSSNRRKNSPTRRGFHGYFQYDIRDS